MPRYVSYYDESNFDSWVEVMNIQSRTGEYKISVYDRDGSRYWRDRSRILSRYQTERISIRTQITNTGNKEGIIMIEPADENPEYEFPAMLTIRGEGQNYKVGNRFVPFIRVP